MPPDRAGVVWVDPLVTPGWTWLRWHVPSRAERPEPRGRAEV